MNVGHKVAHAWVNSPQADAVAKYYVQGHRVSETAKKFGVSKCQINNLVKIRGLTNGRQWGGLDDDYKESMRKEAEQRLVDRLDSLGFDYLGGYTNKTGSITMKCRACGDIFERTVDFVKRGNLICKKCEHEKTLVRQGKRRIVRQAEVERRRAEREAERLSRPPKNYYADLHDEFLNRTGICKICGKTYTVREYVRSCGMKYARDNGVCSKECRKEKLRQISRESHKGRQDSHRHRAVKFGCEYDPSVTLKKLVKRDGLRCAICGEMCDWNDHSWSEYAGPKYPSIDHIIPMSKGGGHTWDNVQVVHIICNSHKSDNFEC